MQIQSAMVERLKADRCYAGLLTKNPLHAHWQNTVWAQYEYSLDELEQYLDLRGHPKKGPEIYGLGRNCELFDNTRKWAYKAIREFWKPEYKANWNNAVYEHVEALNGQFITPLPLSEVKSIAKSIANWTFKHFTPCKFRESQAKKGAKGGKAGGVLSKGGGRPNKKALLPQVLALKAAGKTNRSIAVSLGLGSATISRWVRSLKDPIVDPKQSHIR